MDNNTGFEELVITLLSEKTEPVVITSSGSLKLEVPGAGHGE